MVKSLLQGIIQAKESFIDIIASNQDTLNNFLSLDIPETVNKSTFAGDDGWFYEILNNTTGNTKITATNSVTNETFQQLIQYSDKEELFNDLADRAKTIKFGEKTLGDVLNTASSGSDRYESLANATNAFITSPNVDAEALISALEVGGMSKDDLSYFINGINGAMNEEGKVSQYAWLNIINGALSNAKDTCDEGGIVMDSSRPNYVTNVIAMSLELITSTLSTVISAILACINPIIGLIVQAITSIIGLFASVLHNAISTKVKVKNIDASTNYVDGAVHANYVSGTTNLPNGEALCVSGGGVDTYFFTDPSGNSMGINSFFNLDLNFTACQEYFLSKYSISKVGDWIWAYHKTPVLGYDLMYPENCYSNLNEQMNRRKLDGDTLTGEMISTLICHGLSLIRYPYDHSFEPTIMFLDDPMSWDEDTKKWWGYIAPIYLAACWMTEYQENETSIYDFGQDLAYRLGPGMVTAWIAYAREKLEYSYDDITSSWSGCSLTDIQTSKFGFDDDHTLTWRKFSYADYFVGLSGKTYYFSVQTAKPYAIVWVDSIPKSRCFEMNNATLNRVILAQSLIVGIAATSIIAGTIISKKLKYRKFKSRIDSTNSLAAARDAYDENPTSENMQAYYKAQKSYNFKAKLFGWPTYDPVNAWYDYEDTGTDEVPLNVDSIRKLIAG